MSSSCPVTFARHAMRPRRPQEGVTLLIVLVMLVVIGLVSASAMRQAASADLVSNNTRLEHLAKQAAEAALRFCEKKVKDSTQKILPANAATPWWTQLDNWRGDKAVATTLPTSEFKSSFDTAAPSASTLPQCMAEFSPLGSTVYIVTARGFSPDYRAKQDGSTQSGSVVWLQSTLALN